MSDRHILFVDHAAVLGGAELSLLDLAAAYRATSEVLLFSDGPFRTLLVEAGVHVNLIVAPEEVLAVRTSGGLSALKSIPALFWMARQIVKVGKTFDLVHANSQKAFVAAAIARLLGAPSVVWHLRDILTAKHFSKLNRKIAIALANRFATVVLVNSNATGKAFVEAGGRPELVKLLYNGISAEPFDQITPEEVAQLKQELDINDVPLIGSFSRLSYWKGQHVLLNALAKLPNAHALIVGEALFGEEEYAVQLRIQASELGIEDRLHWLGFRRDIPALMKACDVIVHTSTEPEPFGRVIVEGQLAQKPVVAAAAGGATELIQDHVTGWLYQPGNDATLAQILNDIIADPERANLVATQGQIAAKTHFSLESVLTNFEHTLKDAVG